MIFQSGILWKVKKCPVQLAFNSFLHGTAAKRNPSFVTTDSNISVLFSVAVIEPGLALMDEIGRRALTDAFIRFTRETAKTHRFLYNPKFDNR